MKDIFINCRGNCVYFWSWMVVDWKSSKTKVLIFSWNTLLYILSSNINEISLGRIFKFCNLYLCPLLVNLTKLSKKNIQENMWNFLQDWVSCKKFHLLSWMFFFTYIVSTIHYHILVFNEWICYMKVITDYCVVLLTCWRIQWTICKSSKDCFPSICVCLHYFVEMNLNI